MASGEKQNQKPLGTSLALDYGELELKGSSFPNLDGEAGS